MLLAGLGLSVLALAALAVAHPADASAFLKGVFAPGPVAGTGSLLLLIGLLPNAGAWILEPAMGGCIQVTGGAGTSLPPYCFVSYSSLITHRVPGGPRDSYWGFPVIGNAPRVYLVFLALPVIAIVAGAIRAVRKADARTGRQGALVGVMTGAVFTVLFTIVLALATVTIRLEGSLTNVAAGFDRYGPYPVYGFGLALAWGCGGGALIAGLAGRLRSPPAG
jgi:hypothetical protein